MILLVEASFMSIILSSVTEVQLFKQIHIFRLLKMDKARAPLLTWGSDPEPMGRALAHRDRPGIQPLTVCVWCSF